MSVMAIDWEKLRLTLLPHALRSGALTGALTRSMYKPLRRIYVELTAYEAAKRKEREYGPRVKELRTAVAECLGIGEALVVMGEPANRAAAALRRQSDGAGARLALGETAIGLWSDNMVWYNRCFTVSLPQGYAGREAEVRAVLDRWKGAGSRYTITYRN